MAVAGGLIALVEAFFVSRASRQIVFDLRTALFDHVQRLSLQYHSHKRTGDLIQRVTSDVRSLKDLFTDTAVNMIHSFMYFVGMIDCSVVAGLATRPGQMAATPFLADLDDLQHAHDPAVQPGRARQRRTALDRSLARHWVPSGSDPRV